MKILGLHKKSSLHTWGLRGLRYTIVDSWNNIFQLAVSIKRTLRSMVEL